MRKITMTITFDIDQEDLNNDYLDSLEEDITKITDQIVSNLQFSYKQE